MIIKRCTFDQLPYAMQMHDLYIEKIPVAEYRLAIWSNKDTLYYNELKESEDKRFVTLIESEKRFLNNRTMDRPSIPYCDKLLKAMSHLADKGHYKFKECC